MSPQNRWLTSKEIEYSAGKDMSLHGYSSARDTVRLLRYHFQKLILLTQDYFLTLEHLFSPLVSPPRTRQVPLEQIKRSALSIVDAYDKQSVGHPGLQTHLLPTRSQLHSTGAFGRAQMRGVPGLPTGAESIEVSWLQPERLDQIPKPASILRGGYRQGYQARAKLTSARKRALSGGSRHQVVTDDQINLPADSGPQPVVHRSRTVERYALNTGGRQLSPSTYRSRRYLECESFHHIKPLRQQHKSDRTAPGTPYKTLIKQEGKVVEANSAPDAPRCTSKSPQLLTKPKQPAACTLKLPPAATKLRFARQFPNRPQLVHTQARD